MKTRMKLTFCLNSFDKRTERTPSLPLPSKKNKNYGYHKIQYRRNGLYSSTIFKTFEK